MQIMIARRRYVLAAKKTNQIKTSPESIETYKSLAEKHAKFHHPYLLEVRGIGTSSPPDVFVVMQKYTGNLVEYPHLY